MVDPAELDPIVDPVDPDPEELGPEEGAEDVGAEEDTGSGVTFAQEDELELKRSFHVMMAVAFYNLLVFPLALGAHKVRSGFIDNYDTVFWIAATSWQTLVWGFFILNALTQSLEAFASGSIVPLGISAVLIWPLSYLNYSL